MYAPGTFLPPASNYMGNRGMIDAGCDGSGSGTTASPWVANQTRCDSNGVFFGNSRVKISQITDGTGKTFMIGERNRFCMAGTWLGARNPAMQSILSSTKNSSRRIFVCSLASSAILPSRKALAMPMSKASMKF